MFLLSGCEMINSGLKTKWMIRNWSLLMLASGCLSSLAAGYSPRVGQLHPDFTLPGIADNKPVSLSQYRGRKILLIHFASW
jgi:hypothetical protein